MYNTAVSDVKTILESNRRPQVAADVPHEYADKYLLAEFLVNMTLASLIISLETLGLKNEHKVAMKKWAGTSSVTLRFKVTASCEFVKKEVRTEKGSKTNVIEMIGNKINQYVETKVEEWHWKYEVLHELVAFRGPSEAGDSIVISSKNGTSVIMQGQLMS
jgi:hypothetical protein